MQRLAMVSQCNPGMPSHHCALCLCAALAFHAFLLGFAASRHSPTLLEGSLLAAGVSHWELGRYELYRVNPPLVRMVAAIPVKLVGCETDWSQFVDGPDVRPEYGIGRQFIELNGKRSFWLITIARWACIPFSLVGGVVCFLWARELYTSDTAGVLALCIWCTDPTVIGNGQLITNDAAAASLGLAACYCHWKWLQSPTWKRSAAAGILLGMAILAKTTWLLLLGVWPCLSLVWFIVRRGEQRMAPILVVLFIRLALMFVLALWVININYGFDGSFERYDDYKFASNTMRNIGLHVSSLRCLPLPLPRQFLIGLDSQISDFEGGYSLSYLCGQWRESGWWYYYLCGLLVKVPIGTLALALLVLFACVFAKSLRPTLDEFVLLVPAAIVFAVVSSQTAFNHHFRYVLPCFGFGFVFIGKSAVWISRNGRMKSVICALFLLSVGSSVWSYPHVLSYYNELVGGPRYGHRYMLHSATDWGQDLVYLQKWLERHPNACLRSLAYYGGFEPSAVGLNVPNPRQSNVASRASDPIDSPMNLEPGYYALSAMYVWGDKQEYVPLVRRSEFVATAGYSIYIFRVVAD